MSERLGGDRGSPPGPGLALGDAFAFATNTVAPGGVLADIRGLCGAAAILKKTARLREADGRSM